MHVQQKRLPSTVLPPLYDRVCSSVPGSEGRSLSLDSLIGKQALVAFFYPKVTLFLRYFAIYAVWIMSVH
jgi:hypothetical protein